MPPKVKFSKEAIIGTALQLVREEGRLDRHADREPTLRTVEHLRLPDAGACLWLGRRVPSARSAP